MDKNNRILLFMLNLLFFLGVAYICYNYVYCKYDAMKNERKAVYERFCNISKQLDGFAEIQTSMDEDKNYIDGILSLYEDTFYSNEQNKSAYKVKVLELLKDLDIVVKEEDVTQEQKGDNVLIKLTINTNYEKVCKFLFELERYSSVDSVSMDYKGNFTIVASPILFDDQVNDCFSGRSSIDSIEDDTRKSGYFKEIYDKIMEAKNVGDIPSWRDFQPIPKSPFFYYVQPKKVSSVKGGGGSKPVNYGKPDNIVIDGILYEKHAPMVIIGGKFYHQGDVYKNCKIVQINENNIKIDYYGKVYTIKMKE